MKFTITNVSDRIVSLTLVAGLPGTFDVELPEKIEAGKSASGKLTLTAEALETKFEKSFTLQVDDENNSRFTVPVKRSIRKPTADSQTDKKESGG